MIVRLMMIALASVSTACALTDIQTGVTFKTTAPMKTQPVVKQEGAFSLPPVRHPQTVVKRFRCVTSVIVFNAFTILIVLVKASATIGNAVTQHVPATRIA